MSDNAPKTIKVNEAGTTSKPQVTTASVQTTTPAPAPVKAAPAPTAEVPAPLDGSGKPAEPLKRKQEIPNKSAEEAGASKLADMMAPEATAPADPGTDEVLEALRNDDHHRIDEAAKESDIDLESNQILLGPRGDDLVTMLLKHYTSTDAYKSARRDPKSLLAQAIAANDHGWGTTSNTDMEEVLKVDDAEKHLKNQTLDEKFKCVKDGRPNRISHKNSDLAGKEAVLAIKARLGGLVRVNLLNSGFWVALRSPQLDELQEIFASIDFESKQIGRIIGGHFALITDMYLKKKFVELMVSKRIIIESNFKDIFKAGAFVRNLAYHDYDTLLHAVVMLMTRGGLRYRCICPACGNVSIETLDVGACKFINEDLWTDEVAKWWMNTRDAEGKPIRYEEKDLVHYRADILKASKDFEQEIENGAILPDGSKEKVKVTLTFREPTMDKFFSVGENLIGKLNATIDHISNGETDRAELIRSSLAVHSYQLVAPWIEKLTMYKNDGTIDIVTTDVEAILAHLDESVQKDDNLFKTLVAFIAESRFTYIGTHQIHCPKCNARPNTTMDNFYPLEIQTIFFALLSRLWLAGR